MPSIVVLEMNTLRYDTIDTHVCSSRAEKTTFVILVAASHALHRQRRHTRAGRRPGRPRLQACFLDYWIHQSVPYLLGSVNQSRISFQKRAIFAIRHFYDRYWDQIMVQAPSRMSAFLSQNARRHKTQTISNKPNDFSA